jgi:GNAT superfamily N-acetyltransferase
MADVRMATIEQVPALARMMAAAFVEDPMIRWPFFDHDVRERADAMFNLLLTAYAPYGVLVEAGDGGGCAAWIGPDSGMDLEGMNAATWDGVMTLTDDGGARYKGFWTWLEGFLPDEPHWMLDMVGVDPARRGEGIGDALVRYGVERAVTDGVPAFLETGVERNLGFYARFGFGVAHEEDAPGGGPHIWFLRRDP